MRTILCAGLVAILWGAFYTIMPKLSGDVSIIFGLALVGWMSVVLLAIAVSKK